MWFNLTSPLAEEIRDAVRNRTRLPSDNLWHSVTITKVPKRRRKANRKGGPILRRRKTQSMARHFRTLNERMK